MFLWHRYIPERFKIVNYKCGPPAFKKRILLGARRTEQECRFSTYEEREMCLVSKCSVTGARNEENDLNGI